MVELKSSPEREVKGSAADGLEREGEGVEALTAKAFGPKNDRCACDQAGENAADGADPLVVNGPLEKEGSRNEQRDKADTAKYLGADAILKRAAGFRKVLREVSCGRSDGGRWGRGREFACFERG